MPKRLDVPAFIFAGFSILYPLIAVALLRTVGPTSVVLVVIAVLVARLMLPVLRGVPLSITVALIPVVVAMAMVATFDRALSIRLYPVFMNATMLAAFGATLLRPPSMVERFARSFEPDLPEEGVRYTRTVTAVWMAYFCLNGSIALWTVLQPGWEAWVVYNGFISYVAAGLLFAGEYLVRQRVRRKAGQ
jgi:uncharacterized membrane protein